MAEPVGCLAEQLSEEPEAPGAGAGQVPGVMARHKVPEVNLGAHQGSTESRRFG